MQLIAKILCSSLLLLFISLPLSSQYLLQREQLRSSVSYTLSSLENATYSSSVTGKATYLQLDEPYLTTIACSASTLFVSSGNMTEEAAIPFTCTDFSVTFTKITLAIMVYGSEIHFMVN